MIEQRDSYRSSTDRLHTKTAAFLHDKLEAYEPVRCSVEFLTSANVVNRFWNLDEVNQSWIGCQTMKFSDEKIPTFLLFEGS